MGLINLLAFGHWEDRVIFCGNSYPKSVVERYKADCAYASSIFDAWRSRFPREFLVNHAADTFLTPSGEMIDIGQYMASIGYPKPQVWRPRWPGDFSDAA